MKILGLEFRSRARKWAFTEPKETYLVVDTSRVKHYYGDLVSVDVCSTYECDSEKEAQEYIDEYISKNRLKNVRVFKEIRLTHTLTSTTTD